MSALAQDESVADVGTAAGTGTDRTGPRTASDEGGSTGFGATVFDPITAAKRPAGPASAFDVCHVGVTLRALLFVHGVMAIGLVFTASSVQIWIGLVGAGSSVALPAVLMWLLALCGLKKPLAGAPVPAQC